MIDNLQRIEQAAREWRATLDAIKDLVWICDKDCRLLRVNRTFATQAQIEPKQIIGKYCYDVFSWAKFICSSCPHKLTLGSHESTIKEFLEPKSETYVEVCSSPILNENGEITGSVCIGRNVTENRQNQKKIEQAAREWRATLDAIRDMVWITDRDCNLLRVNKAYADFIGIEPKKIIGKSCKAVFSWAKDICAVCPHQRTLATKEPAINEFYNNQQDIYLEISTSPILNDKNEVTASVCVGRDITGRKQSERIENELRVATEIQANMLPRIFPAFPTRKEFDVFATMKPAKEVGGDFYDFFFITENKFCIIIGDVCGKGIPAALFMAITKTLLKTEALRGFPPDEMLFRVNNIIYPDNETSMFVTVFCAVLDLETGCFQYANGGHNPPFIRVAGGEFEAIPVPRSLAVGTMEDTKFVCRELTLKPNNIIFMYTDGVTEATTQNNQLFSEQRLKQDLDSLQINQVKEIVVKIGDSIDNFVQNTPQSDDITMLALKYNGK